MRCRGLFPDRSHCPLWTELGLGVTEGLCPLPSWGPSSKSPGEAGTTRHHWLVHWSSPEWWLRKLWAWLPCWGLAQGQQCLNHLWCWTTRAWGGWRRGVCPWFAAVSGCAEHWWYEAQSVSPWSSRKGSCGPTRGKSDDQLPFAQATSPRPLSSQSRLDWLNALSFSSSLGTRRAARTSRYK